MPPREPHEEFKRNLIEHARGTSFEKVLAENPDAVDKVARRWDAIANPLTHFMCAVCGVRFGVEEATWRFLEQTAASIFCPFGHEGHLAYPETQS